MTGRAAVVVGDGHDPYRNIALEACLLEDVVPGLVTLYLWRNERTVVVGRNQDEGVECDVAALEADGGHLARRLSGGGAVYHDLGNLNFTFLLPTADYDEARQTEVVLRAVRALGVDALRTGRNDLLADGRKFSGHAYYHTGGRSYHHGTLMVDVDDAPLARYLRPSAAKLASKGVGSVRSRVVNLRELSGSVTVEGLTDALVAAFGEVYGRVPERLGACPVDEGRVTEKATWLASDAWLRRGGRGFGRVREARFGWGEARLGIDVGGGGRVSAAALWTDGLDANLLERVPETLVGCEATVGALTSALVGGLGMPVCVARDIALLAIAREDG